jgi:uncharacterized protein (TIGR02300 family)
VAKPELGAKRQCQSCGVKFFDLNKDPVVCPKCGAIFHLAPTRIASRSGDADDEVDLEKEGADVVSLDEVEVDESKVESIDVDADVEIDDAVEEDDTFLEEEEGDDDDVSGLIDGDIDTDEES